MREAAREIEILARHVGTRAHVVRFDGAYVARNELVRFNQCNAGFE